MAALNIEQKLTKLKRELEEMSLQHAANMADSSLAKSPERLEAESRRARMLAHRIAQLIKMLNSEQAS